MECLESWQFVDSPIGLSQITSLPQKAFKKDQETGILLLSDKVKGHMAEEQLQAFFSRAEKTQEAHEIGGGKAEIGRVRFFRCPVQLPPQYPTFFADDCHSYRKDPGDLACSQLIKFSCLHLVRFKMTQ